MILSKSSERSRRGKAARVEEKRVASALGGKVLPASGALRSKLDGKSARGDLQAQGFWVEHKTTDKESITIQKSWLDKVSQGALDQAQWPALTFSLPAKNEYWIGLPDELVHRIFGGVVGPFEHHSDLLISSYKLSRKIAADFLSTARSRCGYFSLLMGDLQSPATKQWMFIAMPLFLQWLEKRNKNEEV